MDSLVSGLAVYPERLTVCVGEEYPVMVDGSRKLAALMQPHTTSAFLPLMDEDHNTILHEVLYRSFNNWYNPTVPEPYHFANARDGLNVCSAPGLDSAVVGKLTYGASLEIISAEVGIDVVVDGLTGKWIYIGADSGRGFLRWLRFAGTGLRAGSVRNR